MSEHDSQDSEHTHRPLSDAKRELLGCYIGVNFHPAIRLDRKKGFDFASTISDYVQTEKVESTEENWLISNPSQKLTISITPQSFQFSQLEVRLAQELVDERYKVVLDRFADQFKPEIMLSSAAMIRALLPIDGDARAFIGGHLMNMLPSTIRFMERPLHILGLRLFFPPYTSANSEHAEVGVEEKKKIHEDWSADVKIESWLDDPSKLFLEVDGRWDDPKQWDKNSVDEAWSRLSTVSNFVDNELRSYLNNAPDITGDEE